MITIENQVHCSECNQTKPGVTFIKFNETQVGPTFASRLSVCLDCLITAVKLGKETNDET